MSNKNMIDIAIEKYGLDKMNSLSKFPSILPFHKIGKRGGVTEELNPIDQIFLHQEKLGKLFITEKIDGIASRAIVYKNDYLLADKNNFVYAKGDRIYQSIIIDQMKETVEEFIKRNPDPEKVHVIYGITYGYKIGNGTDLYIYNDSKKRDFRIFDIYSMGVFEFNNILGQSTKSIIDWRESNKQEFWNYTDLMDFCDGSNVKIVPVLETDIFLKDIPDKVDYAFTWLKKFKASKAILDGDINVNNQGSKYGQSKGIVIRNNDRSFIRQLLFEEYIKGKLTNYT